MSGQKVTLAEVSDIRGGGKLGLTSANFTEHGVPAYGAGGVNGRVSQIEYRRPGIVLSSIGARCGKCFYADGDWSTLANTQVILPDLLVVNPRFLWYQLNDESSWHRSGTAQPFIKPADVKAREIHLPPIEEQRRIADILDRADELRAKRREALAHLDELNRSIFLDMFGDPQSNPMDWPRAELGSYITAGPTNGLYKPSSDYGSGTPIVRIDSFYNGVLMALGSLKRLALSEGDLVRFALRADDVLVNRVNSLEYLGKCAIVPELREPTVFESNIMRLRLDVTMLAPRYAVDFLCSDYVRDQIRSSAKRAVNQASINQKDVRSFQINVPPLGLQSEYVRRRSVIEQVAARQRLGLHLQEEVFVSLRRQAFAGQL